jgi:glycosyltransferase involved in cell wall biosynthesis
MTPHQTKKTKRIAILGSRGIPAEFGGFETFAEQLATRLVSMDHDVTVFCENTLNYREPTYRGVNLIHLSTPNITGLRSVWFDLVSIIKTLRGYDVVYMLGYHAAFAFVLPWLFRVDFWTNMDGLEWKRDKWSPGTKRYLRLMEWFAARFSRRLIADAEGIAEHLRCSYGPDNKIKMIPYGAYLVEETPDASLIADYGVDPGEYYLVICRLEPENHVHQIIQGFIASSSPRKLIIVGDNRSGTAYVQRLLKLADDRVLFAGTVYDPPRLTALRWYCRGYFHGHSVGGTNPSLLEAMACRNHTIAHDNIFNREVTDDHAEFFTTASDIPPIVARLDQDVPNQQRDALLNRIRTIYNWENIAHMYNDLLQT